MSVSLRCWFVGLLLCLTALVGCESKKLPDGALEFRQVPIAEAPADIQAYAVAMKTAPGLYMFHEGKETYLLLQAGKVDVPGALKVTDVRQVGGVVRLQAVLTDGRESDAFPGAVIQLKVPESTRFKARVSLHQEQVIELDAVPVVST